MNGLDSVLAIRDLRDQIAKMEELRDDARWRSEHWAQTAAKASDRLVKLGAELREAIRSQ